MKRKKNISDKPKTHDQRSEEADNDAKTEECDDVENEVMTDQEVGEFKIVPKRKTPIRDN